MNRNEILLLIGACAHTKGPDPRLDSAIYLALYGDELPSDTDALTASIQACVALKRDLLKGWYFTLSEDAMGASAWFYNGSGMTAGQRGETLEGAFLSGFLSALYKEGT